MFNSKVYPTLTIDQATSRYAPAADNNDTKGYSSFIKASLGGKSTSDKKINKAGTSFDEQFKLSYDHFTKLGLDANAATEAAMASMKAMGFGTPNQGSDDKGSEGTEDDNVFKLTLDYLKDPEGAASDFNPLSILTGEVQVKVVRETS